VFSDKVISPHIEWGAIFPAYRDLASKEFHLGTSSEPEDLAFVDLVLRMLDNISRGNLPANALEKFANVQPGSRQASHQLYDDLLNSFQGTQRDIFLYHLYGLATHSMFGRQRAMGDAAARTLTRDRFKMIRWRMFLDASDLGMPLPTEAEGFSAPELAEMMQHGAIYQPDEYGVSRSPEVSCGFVIENPGTLEPILRKVNDTALMGMVHGRPFYFLNTPYKDRAYPDQTLFERDEITVMHGMGRSETVTVLPHGYNKDAPTPVLLENEDHKFFAALPSLHKAGHIAHYNLPRNRTLGPASFLEEKMAPIIRDEYGRLLTQSVHRLGVEMCLEHDFSSISSVMHKLAAGSEAKRRQEESRREALSKYYAEEDVGMF
jgi:hypothetical protein